MGSIEIFYFKYFTRNLILFENDKIMIPNVKALQST